MHWFVMRDLKRPNAKEPAYKQLGELSIEVFTPLRWHLPIKKGKRVREKIPFIQDLLFVHDTRKHLDSIVERIPTLQYRYQKGKGYRSPMTVPDNDMERFIRRIHIIGGNLDGYEGVLLSTRGSKAKCILVELPNWLVAAVEVNLEYVQFL